MEQNNLNTRLRNQFTKLFLCRFIDFSKYENNPELAQKHYKLSSKIFIFYGLFMILLVPLAASISMVMVLILFTAAIGRLSLNAFICRLLDMNVLDEKTRLMKRSEYGIDIFTFFLVMLPLLLLLSAIVYLIIK